MGIVPGKRYVLCVSTFQVQVCEDVCVHACMNVVVLLKLKGGC